jgi:hypothetical protein
MTQKASPQKFLAISSISILLSMFTVVMGAPLMRVLRKSYGPVAYWLAGAAVTALFWFLKAEPIAVFTGSIWMTLGVYGECEQKGFGWWISGLLSVLSGAVVGGLGTLQMFKMNGIQTIADVQKIVDEFAHKIEAVNPNVKVDTSLLVQQIPSAIVIMLILALGLGLIFERRTFSWLGMPREKVASQLKLLDYRVPDFVIWIAMSAFLLTMVSFGVKAIAILAINIVNVAVVLYFFQGLAVLEVFLNSIRAGALTRILTYIILIGQLFLLLSLIGLVDYWVDFRRRIKNLKARTAENS